MLTGRIIGTIERRTGTNADYLRDLVAASGSAFRKLLRRVCRSTFRDKRLNIESF